jgi:hypothetical protein
LKAGEEAILAKDQQIEMPMGPHQSERTAAPSVAGGKENRRRFAPIVFPFSPE